MATNPQDPNKKPEESREPDHTDSSLDFALPPVDNPDEPVDLSSITAISWGSLADKAPPATASHPEVLAEASIPEFDVPDSRKPFSQPVSSEPPSEVLSEGPEGSSIRQPEAPPPIFPAPEPSDVNLGDELVETGSGSTPADSGVDFFAGDSDLIESAFFDSTSSSGQLVEADDIVEDAIPVGAESSSVDLAADEIVEGEAVDSSINLAEPPTQEDEDGIDLPEASFAEEDEEGTLDLADPKTGSSSFLIGSGQGESAVFDSGIDLTGAEAFASDPIHVAPTSDSDIIEGALIEEMDSSSALPPAEVIDESDEQMPIHGLGLGQQFAAPVAGSDDEPAGAAPVLDTTPTIDLPDAVMSDAPEATFDAIDLDDMLGNGSGHSSIDLAELSPGDASGSKTGSSRDLIAEELESGHDLLGASKPTDDIEVGSLPAHDPDDSSAVDLGSLTGMPAVDDSLTHRKMGMSSLNLSPDMLAKQLEDEANEVDLTDYGDGAQDAASAILDESSQEVPANLAARRLRSDSAPEVELDPAEYLDDETATDEDLHTESPAVGAETEVPALEEEEKPAKKANKTSKKPQPAAAGAQKPRGRAGAWMGGSLVGGLFTAAACMGLWVFGIEPPSSLRQMVGVSTQKPAPINPQPQPINPPVVRPGTTPPGPTTVRLFHGATPEQEQQFLKAEDSMVSFIAAEVKKNPNAPLKIDPATNPAFKELEKQDTALAAWERGVFYEMARDEKAAKLEFEKGLAKPGIDPELKSRLENALNSLTGEEKPAGGGGMSRAPREKEPLTVREALLVMILFQAPTPEAPAAPKASDEAGYDFWKAYAARRKKDYKQAIEELQKARAKHDVQRIQKWRKQQNPLSDPSEKIFTRACEELEDAWKLQARLVDPKSYLDLAADDKNRDLRLDALVKVADDKLTAALTKNLVATLSKKLVDEKILDKEAANSDELLDALKAKQAGTTKEITDLTKAVKDEKDKVAKLTEDVKSANDLAKTTADKLAAAQTAAAAAQDNLKAVAAAVNVEFKDPKKDTLKVLDSVKTAVRVAEMKDPKGVIVRLEGAVTELQDTLKQRWKPEEMLSVWLPLVDTARNRKDLNEKALYDVTRVIDNPDSSDGAKVKASVIHGLVLRNEGKYREAETMLDGALKNLGDNREWGVPVSDALRDLRDLAGTVSRQADSLLAQGRTDEALATLKSGAIALPDPAKSALLARRSLLNLDLARLEAQVRPGVPRVQEAQADARAATASGVAEGFYAAGRVAEELGQYDEALKNYDAAIAAHKATRALDAAGGRYLMARARVLLRARTPDARPAAGAWAPKEGEKKALACLRDLPCTAELTAMLLAVSLQGPGFPGAVPTKEQQEADRMADQILADPSMPFDLRAQALAIKGLYTRALRAYTVGLARNHLLPPAHANLLLDLIENAPGLKRPETVMIPDPLEGEKHYSAGLNFFAARNFANAEREFLLAIENDNGDARYFYYLGMARLAQGNRDGYDDLDQGAYLERLGRPERAAVSAALERIQGPMRVTINAIRTRPARDVTPIRAPGR
jgi:tetratricopeptide (TPR) repeat protein